MNLMSLTGNLGVARPLIRIVHLDMVRLPVRATSLSIDEYCLLVGKAEYHQRLPSVNQIFPC
jgi:hypothetical protein